MNKGAFRDVYKKLYSAFGPQHWWPGDTQFEVIVGAILTQNTAWTNVEKAIANLKDAGALESAADMIKLRTGTLAKLIKPAGYYNIKAKRIRNFLRFLERGYGSDIKALESLDTPALRNELLSVNGIGPETCDSILLYAFGRPVFVVDAYTKRVFSRHGFFDEDLGYAEVQSIFTENLRRETAVFNEYHALIVRLAKEFCRARPKCGSCPLNALKSLANRHYR